HPLYVDRAQPGDLELLRHRLELGGVVAVGEIGLDHFVDGADRERQGVYFSGQLELAREFGLPVVLHIRRAVDDILKYLRRIRVRGGIAHAFNGSAQQARQFVELGFCLGFGGTMSFEGSRRIRRLATELPEAALVLETDAPDMAPEWARGQRNAPCNVARFASELARLRNCATPEVVRFTGANALRVIPGLA
ncbi:MAG: TatD family hydrolase, partial [Ottowia sp.]|nr:TatD family hydrolase [Ottowia sp.]